MTLTYLETFKFNHDDALPSYYLYLFPSHQGSKLDSSDNHCKLAVEDNRKELVLNVVQLEVKEDMVKVLDRVQEQVLDSAYKS